MWDLPRILGPAASLFFLFLAVVVKKYLFGSCYYLAVGFDLLSWLWVLIWRFVLFFFPVGFDFAVFIFWLWASISQPRNGLETVTQTRGPSPGGLIF